VLVSHPRFEEHTTEEVDQVLATNLAAPMHLARLVLPGMRTRREGIILNVSSMCAQCGMRWCYAVNNVHSSSGS
jgi:short-subunit dehydrogenase